MFAIFIIFVFIIIIVSICFCGRNERERSEPHEDLPSFRAQRQDPGGDERDQATPPAENEERRELVLKYLYQKEIQSPESIRTLSNLLATASDDYSHRTKSQKNMIARAWDSAESSVKLFRSGPPECSICLDAYQPGDVLCWSKNELCNHLYHKECILGWAVQNNHDTCPLCRNNLLVDDDNVGEA